MLIISLCIHLYIRRSGRRIGTSFPACHGSDSGSPPNDQVSETPSSSLSVDVSSGITARGAIARHNNFCLLSATPSLPAAAATRTRLSIPLNVAERTQCGSRNGIPHYWICSFPSEESSASSLCLSGTSLTPCLARLRHRSLPAYLG